jgi:hypothetical protein
MNSAETAGLTAAGQAVQFRGLRTGYVFPPNKLFFLEANSNTNVTAYSLFTQAEASLRIGPNAPFCKAFPKPLKTLFPNCISTGCSTLLATSTFT